MAGRLSTTDRIVTSSVLVVAAIVGSTLTAARADAQTQTYFCTGGFAPVAAPFIPLTSLKTVPNPVIPADPITGALTVRADLAEYVANLSAAIQLGKVLFWDMQAGSDNKTACSTCHFQAGADVRFKNQMHQGPNAKWDASYAANATFASADFPFTAPPKDLDNIAGSQGVRLSTFKGFSKSGAELTASVSDPVFSVGGVNVRQVTAKNSGTVVNAVFNHRNFWNGRAQPDFNGVNPFGSRDTTVRVWTLDYRGSPIQVYINIKDASLASQAVGPPLNTVEMSASGRTFPDLGKKLLLAKPLGLQRVDATDSVLGPLADATTGLKTTYTALIQQAFQPKWWKSTKNVTVNGKSYSMMQANFSLYWGLAIMMYQATLVSDDTPMDQYLASRVIDPATGMVASHDPAILDSVVSRLASEGITITRQQILDGLTLFERPVAPPPSFPVPTDPITGAPQAGVGCIGCHVGAETTSASMRNLVGHGLEAGDVAFKNAGFDLRMERMFTKLDWTPPGPITPVPAGADQITFDPSTYLVNVTGISAMPVDPPVRLPVATYDAGWYNIGVRPSTDDHGLGGQDPFGKGLSWTQSFQALPDPTFIKIPGNGLGCAGAGNASFPNELLNASGFPLLSGPLFKTEASDVDGTFKTSSLRNVELTGPYFHNGGTSTLMQVIEFYDAGGNFLNPTLAPAMVPLNLTAGQRTSLVAFLLALTDERVRIEQGPFDHPQLFVPNGDDPAGTDAMQEIPAVGRDGRSFFPVSRFLNLNPFVF